MTFLCLRATRSIPIKCQTQRQLLNRSLPRLMLTTPSRRGFSSSRPASVDAMQVFNREVKRKQRDRAAMNAENSRTVDYLRNEIANRLIERMLLIARRHEVMVDIGAGAGSVEQAIVGPREDPKDDGVMQSRIGRIIMTEMASKLLYRDADPEAFPFNKQLDITRLTLDEENLFTPELLQAIKNTPGKLEPYSDYLFENSVNTVVSNLSVHWVNDLPGLLQRIKYMLVPDGMFIASMMGGDSLFELRTSLQIAEMDVYNRVAPRLSPLADVRDMGNLLQQAGFNLITIDVDDVIVSFPDMMSLMKDLRDMGESNAVLNRPHYLPRDLIKAAEKVYKEMHANEDGSLPATFRIIYMIGWKPSDNQPKPLERGTADVSFKDIL
ncbi:hypothetical protein BZA70DRAFT_74926 [Myxozyma melibiosi]|uniref:S-adenosyl-L-methionine-dependent methyltransferase n=1 Tax=Myxozyma melibiosi TaxID=54550 RepID=A0ABR1F2K3_9ASCO